MERTATTSRVDFLNNDPQSTCRTLASPDAEVRGRRRRRDPLNLLPLPRHNPSESSTLRGRCRHRSASRMNLVTLSRPSTAAAAAHGKAHRGDSPERRLLAAGIVIMRPEGPRHRRGQSPSRSRSPGGSEKTDVLVVSPVVMMAQRRRQRTQSRSRRHRLEGTFVSVALAGRPTLGFKGWVAEDSDANGKD